MRQPPAASPSMVAPPASSARLDRLPRGLALALLALLAAAPTPAVANSLRLSEGLPFSDVSILPSAKPRLSADGRFAVYVHDAVVDGASELWSVPAVGGSPVRLSGLLPTNAQIVDFTLTADSATVVYRAPQDTTDVYELYSAPIAGPEGAWVKLNPALAVGGDVHTFALAPTATRVAFIADVETDGIADLWSVPVGGGAATRHRPALTAVGSTAFENLAVSPAGERAAFLANFNGPLHNELWSARLDGVGGVIRLNDDLAPNAVVQPDFAFSPDGARVLYRADQDVAGGVDLYSVPAGDGTPVRLNGPLVANGNVMGFALSPDGSRVLYLADQEVDERYELWSVPISGGAAVKLSGALIAGGDVASGSYAASPDSSRVVYLADQLADERYELWSVPITGGAAVKLNGALAVGGDILDFAVTPDSSRVVYRGDQQTGGAFELYAVPIGGGAAVRVNDPLGAGGRVYDGYAITPSGDHVVFQVERTGTAPGELYRAPLSGGTDDDERMSGDSIPDGFVLDFSLHPDGLRAIYVADEEVDQRYDLHVGDPCLLCDGFESGDLRRWQP